MFLSCAALSTLRSWCGIAFFASADLSAASEILTRTADVRALSLAGAEANPPLRLRGTITYLDRFNYQAAFVQDESGGIYVDRISDPSLKRGMVVEIEGYAHPGKFAPSVMPRKWRIVGQAEMPPPRLASFEDFASGALDSQWLEVRGIVRSVSRREDGRTDLVLRLKGGSVNVLVTEPLSPEFESLPDCAVRLKGVSYSRFQQRKFAEAWLATETFGDLTIERRGSSDPFALPTRSVAALFGFQKDGASEHRVKTRGTVLFASRGEAIFLRDETGPLKVLPVRFEPGLDAGDIVEAVGFTASQHSQPSLEHALYRKVATSAPPMPRAMEIEKGTWGIYDGDLVRLEARLVDSAVAREGVQLFLEAGGIFCTARGAWADVFADSRKLERESRIAVTGIWQVTQPSMPPLTLLPEVSRQILMRSPADIAVVEMPPWWNLRRVLWTSAALVGICGFATAMLVHRSRLRLREQALERSAAERQFAAILEERNRLSREIHDTLSQALTGISVQIECARERLGDNGGGAAAHLDLAGDLVRASLTEARRSIGNMRAQILERYDLPSALRQIGEQLTRGTSIAFALKVQGTQRRLSPHTENNLLRIGQEALTNAVRHAKPRAITLQITYEASFVKLDVQDDGCGFPTDPTTSEGSPGLGLVGMQERVRQMHGQFTANTPAEGGVQIAVTLPA